MGEVLLHIVLFNIIGVFSISVLYFYFLAVQDISIGDIVTLTRPICSESGFNFSVFRTLQSGRWPMWVGDGDIESDLVTQFPDKLRNSYHDIEGKRLTFREWPGQLLQFLRCFVHLYNVLLWTLWQKVKILSEVEYTDYIITCPLCRSISSRGLQLRW